MNIAIILTGGSGSRMKSNLPKQFIEIEGKPLFIYTLEKFVSNKNISRIILIINDDFKKEYKSSLIKFNLDNEIELVSGGKSRQLSVYNALNYLKTHGVDSEDIILIHDGARPLVQNNIIDENIRSTQINHSATITVTNIVDTIVDKEYNLVDRSNLLAIQTPQTFIFSHIYAVHNMAIEDNIFDISDDGQLIKKYNGQLCYVEGDRFNIKITTQDDLVLFETLIKRR